MSLITTYSSKETSTSREILTIVKLAEVVFGVIIIINE